MEHNHSFINLKDISFGYSPGALVFNQLNFILRPGERVGLVGENGSGKTTLLHLIMGLQKNLTGEVEVFNKIRQTESEFKEVRERIGFLFQDADDQLFCPSVAEDIAFGPLNLRKTHAETKKSVKETLTTLNLGGYENRLPHKLSSGEKKLVAFATVLAMTPEVLLLDEPTAGLDEEKTELIIHYLNNNPQLSYLIISHDWNLLQRTTSKIYKIENRGIHET